MKMASHIVYVVFVAKSQKVLNYGKIRTYNEEQIILETDAFYQKEHL